MKPLKLTLIVVYTLLLISCREASVPEELTRGIDSIACKWIPVPEEGVREFNLIENSPGKYILKGETDVEGAKKEIVDFLNASGVFFSDSVTLLPDTAILEKRWGLVTISVCNMRKEPAHSSEMGTQALMGTPVRILKKDGGWLLIQTPDSYLGWTRKSEIFCLSEDEISKWKNADRIICTTNYGTILDMKGEAVSDFVFGDIIVKSGENSLAYEVTLPDGRSGLISRNNATDFRLWSMRGEPEVKDLISFARSLMGIPYLWGGTSTKGLDCSGYAKTIYFSGGKILTRDASSQYLYGNEVPLVNLYDSLAAGDLLYFGDMRDGVKNMTHTGLYIGDSEVIHSSAGNGCVRINSLDSTRANYSSILAGSLLGAKRYLGSPEAKGNMPVLKHNWYF